MTLGPLNPDELNGPMHISRSWVGDAMERNCPCKKAPCGHVDDSGLSPDCDQHPYGLSKVMRRMHPASRCAQIMQAARHRRSADEEGRALLREVAGHYLRTPSDRRQIIARGRSMLRTWDTLDPEVIRARSGNLWDVIAAEMMDATGIREEIERHP